MLHRALPLALLVSPLLLGQGIFTNANKPGEAICPRVMQEKTELNYKGQYGRNAADASARPYYEPGTTLFPAAERKDVSAFVAHPEKGEGRSIASLKGKVVLVGLWSKNCDPSAKMLLEMASIYPKRDAAGFEILAVNFDENQQEGGIEGGWRAINKFRTKNRAFFESSQMPVYTPGLGKEGPSNFMEMVMSLPALFVVDRAGRLAEIHIGYKDGYVGEALKRVLRERPAAAPVAAPQPQ